MKKLAALSALFVLGSAPALSQPEEGIQPGKASVLRNLVPAERLEQASNQQYAQLKQQAAEKGALAPDSHPQLKRLRAIAQGILPHASRFNPRAEAWQWEVNLIGSRQLNAFCMPGGKIAFFSGLIDTLKLTDDEIAVVMGHEVAHALQEHARERLAKNQITHGLASLASDIVAGTRYGGLAQLGIQGAANLTTLKFSRDDETEADAIGLDLAARAGFDPRAGISLWRKMSAADRGGTPLSWLSTHPAGNDRIREIERHLPEVMPLYEAARRRHQ